MDDKRTELRSHTLSLKERNRMSAGGIEDVESFDDDKIIAYTTEGQMTIKGSELKINRLSVEDGELEIEGIIDSIEYSDSHQSSGGSIWGKIFK